MGRILVAAVSATLLLSVALAARPEDTQALTGSARPTASAAPAAPSPQEVGRGVPGRQRDALGAQPAAVRTRASLTDHSLVVDGRRRTFRLYVPPGLTRPAPVVVQLTGWTLTGDPDAYMQVRREAARRGVVVLHPRGWGASWNAGACCGAAVRQGVDDVAALDAVLAEAARSAPIDRSRVLLLGFSNGGMMAYHYACRRPGSVAGIGVVAAAWVSPCVPRRAVPVMHVHGTADGAVPFRGGWSPLLGLTLPSVRQTTARLRAVDAAAGAELVTVPLRGVDHAWPRPGWQGGYPTSQRLLDFLLRQRGAAPPARAGG